MFLFVQLNQDRESSSWASLASTRQLWSLILSFPMSHITQQYPWSECELDIHKRFPEMLQKSHWVRHQFSSHHWERLGTICEKRWVVLSWWKGQLIPSKRDHKMFRRVTDSTSTMCLQWQLANPMSRSWQQPWTRDIQDFSRDREEDIWCWDVQSKYWLGEGDDE